MNKPINNAPIKMIQGQQSSRKIIDNRRITPLELDFDTNIREEMLQPSKKQKKKVLEKAYLYPRFLNYIGNCCTPFNLCCHCCCACCFNSSYFQQSNSKCGLLQTFGSFERILDPGINILNPISQQVIQINKQTKFIQYTQTVFTKDNVQFDTITIVFYRVIQPIKLAYKLGTSDMELDYFMMELGQGTLRHIVGERILDEVISKRDLVGLALKDQMNKIISDWGIYVQSSSIKDMKLNKEIANILSEVAKTRRLMQATLISYKADVQCGKLIKQMSQIIDTKPAYQIRYLNLLESIIENNNQKVFIIHTSNNYELDQ